MAHPLLTLIIPTRERAHTLAFTLATALAQTASNYEVLVSDNASDDDTKQVVDVIDDPRLRYVNTGRRLSMCDNYEFALENARGEYITIIGDDDAVMPGGLDYLLRRLSGLSEQTIHMWPLHIYDWPGEDQPAQAYYIASRRPETVLDLKSMAHSVMSAGGWKYYALPSPYHCAVPHHILRSIRSRTGRVFHSTQPDVFTAMAIPAFASKAVSVGRTVTFHGRSAQSNGRDFTRGHRPNIERFIQEYGNYQFHSTLPLKAAASAKMIPDAILMAKDMFPETYGGVSFGYSAMWAYICRLGFTSRLEAFVKILESDPQKLSYLHFIRYLIIHEVALLRRRLLNFIQKPDKFRAGAPDNIRDFANSLD